MAKTKQAMSVLGNQTKATHLKRLHPFLNRDFKQLKKADMDENTFKELFPEDKTTQLWKLDAIYKYQQCDTKTRETLTTKDSVTSSK